MSSHNYDNLKKTLKGCKQNKRDAQEKLYRDFYPLAHRICTKYMNQQANISELINDSFLKVFKGLVQLDSIYAFTPWFKTIVRNTCLDELRKKRITDNTVEYAEEWMGEGSTTDTTQQDLNEALLFLKGDEKKVFELFSIEGYSHQEIADQMNIPVGTSKWHITKARKKLASIYKAN